MFIDFREKGRGETERHIDWLPHIRAQPEMESATIFCMGQYLFYKGINPISEGFTFMT